MADITFDYQLADNEAFTSPLVSVTGSAAVDYTSSALTQGEYWFRLKQNSGGGSSGWVVRHFYVLSVPDAPTAVSPADDTWDDDDTPTLDWSDPATTTTFNIGAAVDASSVGTVAGVVYSTLQSFQTSVAGRVRTLNFYLGANAGTPTGNLRWTIYTDDTGAPDAVVGTGTFVPVASSLNTVTVNAFASLALAATTDYWLELKPVTVQADGNAWSWQVTGNDYADGTYGVYTDGVFSANGSFDCRFTLSVLTTTAIQVDSWNFRYDDNSGMTSPTTITGLATSTYTFPSPIADQHLYWQAQAVNASGVSDWSTVRVLHVLALPAAPILTFPDDERWVQDFRLDTLGFSWGSVPASIGTITYIFEASDSNAVDGNGYFTGSIIEDDPALAVNEYFPAATFPVQNTYWHVKAENESGEGAWSPTFLVVVTDPLKELIASQPDFHILRSAEDSDALLMRATNPYAAEGKELLIDGDAEAATAAAWTASGAVTTSKQSGARTGGAGSLVLRVTSTSTTLGSAVQTILVPGKWYHVHGWARGDGTAIPSVATSSAIYWTGTSSTSWQEFDVWVTLTSATSMAFRNQPTGSGQYVEFDDLTCKQVDIRPSTDFPAITGRMNIVTNGNMIANYGYTVGANWAFVTDKFTHTPGSTATVQQPLPILNGKSYDVTYTLEDYVAGTLTVLLGATAGTGRTADGLYTEPIVCGASVNLTFSPTSAFDGSFKLVSVVPTDGLLIFNGDFASWTADNPDGWAVSGEIGSDPEVSEVGSTEGHGGTGTGSVNFYSSGTSNQPFISQVCLIIGRRYKVTVVGSYATAGSGTAFRIDSAGTNTIVSAAALNGATFEYIFTATSATFGMRGSTGVPIDITIDSVTIIEINPADGAINGATLNSSAEAALGGKSLDLDGVNDRIAQTSAEENSLFTPTLLTVGAITKLTAADWVDGILRNLWTRATDGSNSYQFIKQTTNNTFRFFARAQGVSVFFDIDVTTISGFDLDAPHYYAMTVNSGTGEMKGFIDGVQVGTTQTGMLDYIGNLAVNSTVDGASNAATGANPWSGEIYLIHHINDEVADAVLLGIAQAAEVA